MSRRANGSLFQPTTPRPVRRNDLKDASKARCSSSTNSSSVAISSAKNVTEHHAVALVCIRRVATLGPPDLPSPPYLPKGGEGGSWAGCPLGPKGAWADPLRLLPPDPLGHP